ncbi:helix-turn-helix domain-containing protein [Viridibacillus sp. NPDC096237]|uniref:helix-turn-helix domain-containing protein n=1 Tax=Viridibacillus sp. NPDC096237 TaxID=3390721 RepID=UPI003CFDB10E
MLDRDLPLKKEIAKNIKDLLKKYGLNQIKLSELSGISKSTLSDYLNCKTLINISNVEKIAAALNVKKSRIDPSFATHNELSTKEKTIETIAAHIDDDVTEEEMEVIKNYIDFIKSQRK